MKEDSDQGQNLTTPAWNAFWKGRVSAFPKVSFLYLCAVYQNVNAYPQSDPDMIKQNLIEQLTASVRWTQTVQNMIVDGATSFTELGPGRVLSGLIAKINKNVTIY